jgi:PhoPQ-activated pathogenicity-related protein
MIQNNNIAEKPCGFYHKGVFLFMVYDVLNFNDCLLQIQKERSRDYSILFNNRYIRIDQNGTLEEYPNELFDKLTDIYSQKILGTKYS